MAQASWTRGYRTDSEYTFGIYPFMYPDNFLLTLVLQGIRPAVDVVSTGADDGRKIVYCELGSGQGMTLNLMAARDPAGQYFGVDYNPNQIRNARAFAEAANISNVRFDELSFADLGIYEVPDCDVIALHGIWSWIDNDMQSCIVEFIKRKLKPGGVVFVSYNCAVGRAADQPLRKLLATLEASSSAKDLNQRVVQTLAEAQEVVSAGAGYFKQNPVPEKRLEGLGDHEPAYVMQEYMNASWQSYFHDEVAAALSDGRVSFVGSVNMANNRLEMALPSEARHLAERFSTAGDIELLKDLWTNNTFRQDIFVRGVQKLNQDEKINILNSLSFGLARKREDCGLQVNVPGGAAKIPEVPYAQVLDALAKGPQSGKQIAALVSKSAPNMTLDGVIGALLAIGYISLVPDKTAAPRIAKSLKGFETALDDLVTAGHERYFGVIPGLATTVSLSSINYYFWRSTRAKVKDRPKWVLEKLKAVNKSVVHDGQPVTDDDEALKLLRALETTFDLTFKPFLSFGYVKG